MPLRKLIIFPLTFSFFEVIARVAHPTTLLPRNTELVKPPTEEAIEAKRGRRAAVPADLQRWPARTIPYLLTNASPEARRSFLEAATAIAHNSALHFVERTDEQDYVYLTSSSSLQRAANGTPAGAFGLEVEAYSVVGKAGGPQPLMLTPSSSSAVLHELMHAIGFEHEHQRSDRDQYIQVQLIPSSSAKPDSSDKECALSDNVEDIRAANTSREEGTLNIGPYDLESVMHYGSSVGIALLNPQQGKLSSEPSTRLSAGDIAALDELYGGAPKNAWPPLTDNGLSVVFSKQELVLAENSNGQVDVQIFPNLALAGAPWVNSENPFVKVTVQRQANHKFTIHLMAHPGSITKFEGVGRKNRIFFHFRTADGNSGVGIFEVTVVKPQCLFKAFRQIVSKWRAPSGQKQCLEARRHAINQQRYPSLTDTLAIDAMIDDQLSVGMAACDGNNPLQGWRLESNGNLNNMSTHCLMPSQPPSASTIDRARLEANPGCRQPQSASATTSWRFEGSRLVNTAYPNSALTYTAGEVPILLPIDSRQPAWQQWEWY